ncbi:MAG: hypothetical protein PHR35_13820 [Kiritimatiellae bacterium]|nr:hypothetical protein [Kiritimatiellia bacterium]
MTEFAFRILTPAGAGLQAGVEQVVVRTADGALGILARHQAMQAAIPAGVVRVQRAGAWDYYATGDALLCVGSDGVSLLASRAEAVSDEEEGMARSAAWGAPAGQTHFDSRPTTM